MNIIKNIESEYLKQDKPVANIGNTVKVYIKIKEGDKERIQVFEGIVIKKKGSGVNETFTVRKIGAHGVGVERTFLINSPKVEKVEIIKIGKIRRAKLYYLRDRIGKKAKLKEDLYAILKLNSLNKKKKEAIKQNEVSKKQENVVEQNVEDNKE